MKLVIDQKLKKMLQIYLDPLLPPLTEKNNFFTETLRLIEREAPELVEPFKKDFLKRAKQINDTEMINYLSIYESPILSPFVQKHQRSKKSSPQIQNPEYSPEFTFNPKIFHKSGKPNPPTTIEKVTVLPLKYPDTKQGKGKMSKIVKSLKPSISTKTGISSITKSVNDQSLGNLGKRISPTPEQLEKNSLNLIKDYFKREDNKNKPYLLMKKELKKNFIGDNDKFISSLLELYGNSQEKPQVFYDFMDYFLFKQKSISWRKKIIPFLKIWKKKLLRTQDSERKTNKQSELKKYLLGKKVHIDNKKYRELLRQLQKLEDQNISIKI